MSKRSLYSRSFASIRGYLFPFAAFALFAVFAFPSPSVPAAEVARGTIRIAEVSGAAGIGGDRLALLRDEGNGVFVLQGAGPRLLSGKVEPAPGEDLSPTLKDKVDVEDLEDAAWNGRDTLFAVTSHSRNRRGDSPDERYRLARLRFDAGGRLVEARQTDALLQAIVNDVPFLADSIRRTPAKAGLNIEGLAWSPEGHLLIGLRSPTVTESQKREHGGQEDAVILRLRNPDGPFQSPPQPAMLGDVVKLDLHGQGIRGMCWDPDLKACWLIAGLSADPNHPVTSPWSLWLWDGQHPPRQAPLPEGVDLETPEAVTVLHVDGRPHLLLVEDGKPSSRYALFPRPEVPGAPAG